MNRAETIVLNLIEGKTFFGVQIIMGKLLSEIFKQDTKFTSNKHNLYQKHLTKFLRF